jgi:type I restriction enzyme, S subunit
MKAGWQVKALGDVCNFQRGLTYAKNDEVDVSNNIVLRATNIDLKTNLLDFSELKYINEDVVVADNKKVKKGSLIICTASGSKSHLGKVAYVDDDYGYAFGGFMGMVTPKNELLPKYLFHLMTSEAYKDYIGALSDGANINNLKFDDLKKFQIPFPSIDEQQRIVVLLDQAFESIAKARANAEQNLQNARALFESHLQSLFTQRGEGWAEKELQDLVDSNCSLSYGIVQPGEEFSNGLPIIRPTDLTSKFITLDGLKLIDPKLASSYKRTTLIGNELFVCVRGSTGIISIATIELKGANVTRGIVPVRFNPDLISQDFGYYLLISSYIQEQIKSKTYGTALMQINIGDLRKIITPFPNLKTQQSLVAKLNELSIETQRLETLYQHKIKLLDELKKSLLQQAFVGEL